MREQGSWEPRQLTMKSRMSEITQWKEAPAEMPDNQSLTPRTHMVTGATNPCRLSSDAQVCMHTHMHAINNAKLCKQITLLGNMVCKDSLRRGTLLCAALGGSSSYPRTSQKCANINEWHPYPSLLRLYHVMQISVFTFLPWRASPHWL